MLKLSKKHKNRIPPKIDVLTVPISLMPLALEATAAGMISNVNSNASGVKTRGANAKC